MSDSLKAFMVVPTYNEVDNIKRLTEEILALLPDLQICIVDDNSPDGTGKVAQELADTHERVHVVHREGKLGLGTAYCAGWKRSIELGAEILMSMDADFSHKPEHIPGILEAVSQPGVDMAIGSRYVTGGKIINFTYDRHIISKGAQLFTNGLLGLTALDCTSGFRAYRKEVLEEIDVTTIRSAGYSFLIEILFRAEKLGKNVAEYPITYLAREHGKSKISSKEILGAFKTVFRLKWEEISGGAS